MRAVIVGGGVMGCATALALADRGVEVLVLERSVPGAEASSAAAGILGAQMEAHGPGEQAAMLVSARDGYAAWADDLRSRTSIDVGYRRSGVLKVAMLELEAHALGEIVGWQGKAGMHAELVSDRVAREIEPELTDSIRCAAYFPDDAQVEPERLLRALVSAMAKTERIIVESGTTVKGVMVEAGRCVGVRTSASELRGDAIVLAAGSWSSMVPGIPAEIPEVKPVRGQLVLLDERPPRVHAIVFGAGGYVVPRGDGRVVCGSTMERVGFRREVTADGVRAVLTTATTLAPCLGLAEVKGMWSSFRPESASGAPLVGKSPLPGLFLATGHHRNGILLAKHTADTVASAIMGS
jgi:glycine oxidase